MGEKSTVFGSVAEISVELLQSFSNASGLFVCLFRFWEGTTRVKRSVSVAKVKTSGC